MVIETESTGTRKRRGYPLFTRDEWDIIKARSGKAKMGIHEYIRQVIVEHELTPSRLEQVKKEMRLKAALKLIKKLKSMSSKSKKAR